MHFSTLLRVLSTPIFLYPLNFFFSDLLQQSVQDAIGSACNVRYFSLEVIAYRLICLERRPSSRFINNVQLDSDEHMVQVMGFNYFRTNFYLYFEKIFENFFFILKKKLKNLCPSNRSNGRAALMSQAEMRLELDEFEETLVILRDFRMQLLIDVYLEDVCVKIITYTVQESGVDFLA